jgi:transcriptional regulator with XRE-family HTH domain
MKRVHPTDKHVGNRLRMRRLMLHKSQSDVANARVTFQQLQKYENGTSRISASRLQGLCAILQVPVRRCANGVHR